MTFPSVIDNTMRSQWRQCPVSFRRAFIENLSPTGTNGHLLAGGAFAAGLYTARNAFFNQGRSLEEAQALGVEALILAYGAEDFPQKPLDRMLDALWTYFTEYPLDTDWLQPANLQGTYAVEFSFCLPLDITHPETGDPILYAGRFDMIARYKDTLVIVDEKTTTRLGETWAEQWTLDSQLTGYIWAARQYGYPVTGGIIRGVSIYADRVRIVSVPISRTEHAIERWYRQLLRDVEGMVSAWQTGEFDYALDKSLCSFPKRCPFMTLCIMEPNEENWLSDYGPRNWNPAVSLSRDISQRIT